MLLILLVVVAVVCFIETRSRRLDLSPSVAALPALDDDLDAFLKGSESRFDDLTDGVEKQIIWHGEKGARTDIAIVYLHGFSATAAEIRPVPDIVAKQLGANLYFTRLAGHGRPGKCMGEVRVEQWISDLAESIAIGQRLGNRIVVMGTSTGATLATSGYAYPGLMDKVAGLVLLSPNFGLQQWRSAGAYLPFFRRWSRYLNGGEWQVEVHNEAHGTYWTTCYPNRSIDPMMQLIAAVRRLDLSQVTVPVLFYYAETDQVIKVSEVKAVAKRWGGTTTLSTVEMSPEDDTSAHVIAGDIASPNQTRPAAAVIELWIKNL